MHRRFVVMGLCSWAFLTLQCNSRTSAQGRAADLTAVEAQDGFDDDARALFLRGNELAGQGNWRDAQEAFSVAFALSHRAAALLNLAHASRELGQRARAIREYRAFLARTDSTLVEERRPEVESRIAELLLQVSVVTIDRSRLGPGESVWIDGEVVEADTFELDAGEHHYRCRSGDRWGQVVRVAVNTGQPLTIRPDSLALRPAEPTRRVDVGASVRREPLPLLPQTPVEPVDRIAHGLAATMGVHLGSLLIGTLIGIAAVRDFDRTARYVSLIAGGLLTTFLSPLAYRWGSSSRHPSYWAGVLAAGCGTLLGFGGLAASVAFDAPPEVGLISLGLGLLATPLFVLVAGERERSARSSPRSTTAIALGPMPTGVAISTLHRF